MAFFRLQKKSAGPENKNPPSNEFKDGKKIAMKKKINIGVPISSQIYIFYFNGAQLYSGEHILNLFKKGFVGFLGLRIKFFIGLHTLKKLPLLFIEFFRGPHVDVYE